MSAPASSADQLEALWHALNDLRVDMEIATRHAYEDGELRTEDHAALNLIATLRGRHSACAAQTDLASDEKRFLADLDQQLESLEGRSEILQLAVA